MKKSKFSDSQIMAILKQAEGGVPVPDLCREHEISTATFYNWGFGLCFLYLRNVKGFK